MFLPNLDKCWSMNTKFQRFSTNNNNNNDCQSYSKTTTTTTIVVSPATVAMKVLVFWIYLDAGGGKYMDPLQGWTYNAKPLPALDTYTRHTIGARYLYAILGPQGLRVMTPVVVYVELLAAPIALIGSFIGNSTIVYFAIILICQLHIGISIAIRNAVLLSLVACAVWCLFLPMGWYNHESKSNDNKNNSQPTSATNNNNDSNNNAQSNSTLSKVGSIVSTIMVCSMMGGNLWFETIGHDCTTGSLRQVWSTLLQNRWNVFIGAEEYVTWEIAPGLLADGSIVDVWGRRNEVEWKMPGSGAPCTSTARPGRWRSFPYLAELQGEEGDVLWSYLCKQWDMENNVNENPGRQLIKFNFFMLQADVLPNMGFSATRKRLIHSFECVPQEGMTMMEDNEKNNNGSNQNSEIENDGNENESTTNVFQEL